MKDFLKEQVSQVWISLCFCTYFAIVDFRHWRIERRCSFIIMLHIAEKHCMSKTHLRHPTLHFLTSTYTSLGVFCPMTWDNEDCDLYARNWRVETWHYLPWEMWNEGIVWKNVIKEKVFKPLTAEHEHYQHCCSFLEVIGITNAKLKCFYSYFFGWGKRSGEYTLPRKMEWTEAIKSRLYSALKNTALCSHNVLLYFHITCTPLKWTISWKLVFR